MNERREGDEIASVLARFSTLEGYASRNQRNGVGPVEWATCHRRGSRLDWERRQTRSSNQSFRAFVRLKKRHARE